MSGQQERKNEGGPRRGGRGGGQWNQGAETPVAVGHGLPHAWREDGWI